VGNQLKNHLLLYLNLTIEHYNKEAPLNYIIISIYILMLRYIK